jgi:N-acetylglucosaminyl-diphospho-decaprenol L-rhamnosyltransferase
VIAVDVVILTWNDGDGLWPAVQSALSQRAVETVVTVVDNGSDPAAHVPDARVRVIRNVENLGVGRGRNIGIRSGSSPYVCVLDSDARLYPDALDRLLAPLVEDPSIGLAAPVFTNQVPEASGGVAPTFADKVRRATNRTDRYRGTPGQGVGMWWTVDFTIGACQLFRREAFEAVGGLDESSEFGPEDVDFCLRLGRMGWSTVQVDGAGCDHPPRRAFRGLATRRGMKHGLAVLRHLVKQRNADARVVR